MPATASSMSLGSSSISASVVMRQSHHRATDSRTKSPGQGHVSVDRSRSADVWRRGQPRSVTLDALALTRQLEDTSGRRSASARGRASGPTTRATTPSCSRTATPATSSTRTATGRMDAIVADLDSRRHGFDVAIENWQHDLNIGSIVRTANAFLAGTVHIVGRRRWNKRGAMVTDRYQHVLHHDTIADLVAWARERGARSSPSTTSRAAWMVDAPTCPADAILLFGQEGPGLIAEALAARRARPSASASSAARARINAAAAAAIVMHEWVRLGAGRYAAARLLKRLRMQTEVGSSTYSPKAGSARSPRSVQGDRRDLRFARLETQGPDAAVARRRSRRLPAGARPRPVPRARPEPRTSASARRGRDVQRGHAERRPSSSARDEQHDIVARELAHVERVIVLGRVDRQP